MKFLIIIFAMFSVPAFAAACGPRAIVVEALTGKYGESRVAAGLSDQGAVVEFWGNAATGSWTITATGPDGQTCLAARGQGFSGDPLAPTKGDPA